MNKVVLATLSFVAGAAAGFAVGYFVTIENDKDREDAEEVAATRRKYNKIVSDENYNNEEKDIFQKAAEAESPQDDDPDQPAQLISAGPAHIAQPGKPGVNYSKVSNIVKKLGLTDPEEIQAIVEDPANMETYEERMVRIQHEAEIQVAEEKKANIGKIIPIPHSDWDDIDEDFDRAELHYFVPDDMLTDDDGNEVSESEYIGNKPRQFGWMDNKEEIIFIKNFPMETKFLVHKHFETAEDWWA